MVPRRRTKLGRPALIGAASLAGVALAATLAGPASADPQSPGPGSGRPTSCPMAPAPTSGPSAPAAGTTTATLSQETKDGLAFSREEERMARDLYAALARVHNGARPMSMITTSEQRHYEAIGTLLTRYGLADPSAGKAAGSYAFPELQKLYDDWFARGKASPQAAAVVGVELEKRDIADLQKLAAQPAPDDVRAGYSNLLTASQHHLAAFQRAADGTGPGTGAGTGAGPGTGRGRMGGGMGGGGRMSS